AWADMLAVACSEPLLLEKLRLLLHTVSFLCLCEFGRANLERRGFRLRRWFIFALLLPPLFSALWRPEATHAMVRYTLGLGGGIAAAAAFWLAVPPADPRCRLLRFAASAMFLYAFAAGLLPPAAPFFPANTLNQERFLVLTGIPIQALRCALTLCVTAAMWRYLRRHHLLRALPLQPLHRRIFHLVHLSILLVIVLGGAMTHHLGQSAGHAAQQERLHQLRLIQAHLKETLNYIEAFCELLACEPATISALSEGTPASQEAADRVLDRFQAILGDAVCYLLNQQGLTIASSNRDSPASFVGKNYGFRPYFQDAIAGGCGRYFALGITSQQRGFYVGRPVRAKTGEIVGVAAIKIGVADLEKHFASASPCGMVSPEGVIFLASHPEMVLRTLQPLSAETHKALVSSQQFGKGPFRPLFSAPLQVGQECEYNGKKVVFCAIAAPLPEWRIFSLDYPSLRVATYRLLTISTALIFILLLLLGYSVWHVLLKAANDLAVSEERYRMLVEDQTEFICRLSPQGIVLFANETLCRYLGLPRSAVIGSRFLPGLAAPAADLFAAAYRKISPQRPIVWHEEMVSLADGQRRWWQWTFRGLSQEGEIREIHAVGRDISDRKAAEEALIRSERFAAVGTLATGVAHHYNNLNMSVLGYAEMALNQPGLTPTLEKWLQNIRQSALRIRDITNNLLILSRPPEAPLKAENLNEIIQRALSLFTALFEQENIEVVCRWGELPQREMEAGQIQQCFVHVLTNAYHALLAREQKRIEIETFVEGETLVARVIDTGCGIAADRLTHIFTPFYSTKGEHASRGSPLARVRGVGLGLSVTQAIIKKHGGEISVQSEIDKGTIVTIRLPRSSV
ncbi:MAG: ATP-binding protein, partial [Planctomycetota bacterium]|nr:ATP-binding protein [Planctomycetota bacterium]